MAIGDSIDLLGDSNNLEQNDTYTFKFDRLKKVYHIFFFSSTRRHTNCLSDWSSDVCSSDLSGSGRRTWVSRPTTTLPTTFACRWPRSARRRDRKSTRLNSSHLGISYAVFCLKKKKENVTKLLHKKKKKIKKK